MMKHLKTILLLLVITAAFSGCAIYHHYGPYYGKLIDAETKEPLEGAVVLAEYITWQWGSPGGQVGHFLDAQEVVSDKNGEFKIPSLNAFAFRPLNTFESEPNFTIFKSKYECDGRPIPKDKHETRELRKLKTNDERLNNLRCYPALVPNNKMEKLIEVNNIERTSLGLQPTHLRR